MSKPSFVALSSFILCLISPAAVVAESAATLSFHGRLPATLAAGAEIVRTYESGAVLVRLRSSPMFGAAPQEWPLVQVGTLALAFMQENGKGRVGVLRGEKAELLPEEFALGSDGRPTAMLDVVVAFDPSTGTSVHAIDGRIVAHTTGVVARAVEVSLTAGGSAAWPVETLELLVVGEDRDFRRPGGVPSENATGESRRASGASFDQVLAALRPPVVSALPSVPGDPSGRAQIKIKATQPGYVQLEISTPPAVRRSAGQVRAIVARSLNP